MTGSLTQAQGPEADPMAGTRYRSREDIRPALVFSVLLHLTVLAAAGSMAALATPGGGGEMEVVWVMGSEFRIPDSEVKPDIVNPEPESKVPDKHIQDKHLVDLSKRQPGPEVVPDETAPKFLDSPQPESLATAVDDHSMNPEPGTRNPEPDNPEPEALNPEPANPEPGIRNPELPRVAMAGGGNLTGILGFDATSNVIEASILELPAPVYPRLSRRRGEEGRVVVEVTISAEGGVRNTEVVESSSYSRLDKAALKAVTRASFQSAVENGVVVDGVLLVAYRFVLHD